MQTVHLNVDDYSERDRESACVCVLHSLNVGLHRPVYTPPAIYCLALYIGRGLWPNPLSRRWWSAIM